MMEDILVNITSLSAQSYQECVLTPLEAGDDPACHGHLAGVGLHGELHLHTTHEVLLGSHYLNTGLTSHSLKLLTV